MPGGAALEPTPLTQRELARIPGAHEGGLHQHLLAILAELEIEPRPKRLIPEAQLHHLRLEDHAPSLEEREELGGVFATNLYPDAAWTIGLVTSKHAKCVAIGRG